MTINRYIGKNTFKCQMCDKVSKSMFEWIGMLTNNKLFVCYKCAKREVGKKHLHELEQMMEKPNNE